MASAQCIVLATRPDLEADVEIEVRFGTSPAEEPVGDTVFDRELLTTGHAVLVGSSLTGELHIVPLPIGWHLVRIYADPPSKPAQFIVWFDRQHAG